MCLSERGYQFLFMNYTTAELEKLNKGYSSPITNLWDNDTREFWSTFSDRIYELHVMPKVLRIGPKAQVLEIGAEFYSKYIRSLFPDECSFSLLDIKPVSHPDIQSVLAVDRLISCDLTRPVSDYINEFDFIVSFGVIGYYNFSEKQCAMYLDNLLKMLKEDGVCAIKVDAQSVHASRVNAWQHLIAMVHDRFSVFQTDNLYDANGTIEYVISYCKKKGRAPFG